MNDYVNGEQKSHKYYFWCEKITRNIVDLNANIIDYIWKLFLHDKKRYWHRQTTTAECQTDSFGVTEKCLKRATLTSSDE